MSNQRSSKSQRELLNFVDNFIQGHGYGPSYREIMRSLGYKSVSTVAFHIDNLIARGYLLKRDHSARSLEVISTNYTDAPIKHIATSSREKWIVDVIIEKYNEINEANEVDILDEIYVLVGALKILGFEEAHTAMKSKLVDFVKAKRKTDDKTEK